MLKEVGDGDGDGDGDADARKSSQHSARMEIPPTHYPAARAASVVESCINYQQGTPHKVFLVQTVEQASLEVSQAEGGAGTGERSLHSLRSLLVCSQLPDTMPVSGLTAAVSLKKLVFLAFL